MKNEVYVEIAAISLVWKENHFQNCLVSSVWTSTYTLLDNNDNDSKRF